MKRTLGMLAVCVLMISSLGAGKEGDWVDLLGGKGLEGWTNLKGQPVGKAWTLEDGVLHLKGKGGDIYTPKEYANFVLEFEWKVAKGSNSGVKYRMMWYGNNREYLGPEYQVLDDQGTSEGRNNPKGSTASIYVLFTPAKDKQLNPPGEWNKGKIVANGTKIEHWLNGQKVAEADTSSPEWAKAVKASKFAKYPDYGKNASGRIMLQDHGTEVWYRNVRIQVLP